MVGDKPNLRNLVKGFRDRMYVRSGSIRDIRDGPTPQSSTIHQPSGSADCANSTPVKSIAKFARFSLDVLCRNAFVL